MFAHNSCKYSSQLLY